MHLFFVSLFASAIYGPYHSRTVSSSYLQRVKCHSLWRACYSTPLPLDRERGGSKLKHYLIFMPITCGYTATTILQTYKVVMANVNSKQLSIYTSGRCGTTLAFIRNHVPGYLMNHVTWWIVLLKCKCIHEAFEVPKIEIQISSRGGLRHIQARCWKGANASVSSTGIRNLSHLSTVTISVSGLWKWPLQGLCCM